MKKKEHCDFFQLVISLLKLKIKKKENEDFSMDIYFTESLRIKEY